MPFGTPEPVLGLGQSGHYPDSPSTPPNPRTNRLHRGNASFPPETRHGFFSPPGNLFHDGLSSQPAPGPLSRSQARA